MGVRPFLFVIGLPLVFLFTILGCWIAKARIEKWKVALFASAGFVALFGFFLYGPFIGQIEKREYMMTWIIKPTSSNGMKESEIFLSFVDYPSYFIGGYSDEMADHLEKNGGEKVKVVFEVTLDYGKVRGYHEIEIAGLKNWQWIDGYGGSSGSPKQSPWD